MQNIDISDAKIHSSDMSTILEDKVNNYEESFFMEYKDVVSDSSLDSSKFENKQLKITELAAEIDKLKEKLEKKNQKVKTLQESEKTKEKAVETLQKQLELKVKNIEEERASVLLDAKYKDEEIKELKKMLAMERERLVQNLRIDTPKQRIIDMEDRLQQLSSDRERLFEEIVNLKKNIDQKDEVIYKLTFRNERLERQANFQGYKNFTNGQNLPVPVSVLNKKVNKPIIGGGGDIWKFQKNNLNVLNVEAPDPQKVNQLKIQKLRSSNTGGLGAMVKDLFGGILG